MKKITDSELKSLQLEILKFVHDFCEREKIKYWLDYGTLIGAVRHNGYIPWDDDIDIGMLRSDFEKFKLCFCGESSRYILLYGGDDNSLFFPYAKICDKTTYLIDDGFESYVNIDLFIYDNAPDDDKCLSKMIRNRDKYRVYSSLQRENISLKPFKLKQLFRLLRKQILLFFPRGYFSKKMHENAILYNHISSVRVGDFLSTGYNIAPKSYFSTTIKHQFEQYQFNIPCDYDDYLKIYYGDWKVFPPVEERVSHHKFDAFFVSNV